MDLSTTIIAKSDQLNAADLMGGPVTVKILEVRKGSADQPVIVELEGFKGRPYKPSKSMRRVLVEMWGPQSSAYAGRLLTLYRDPAVKWAGEPIGGIKISHMSHVEKAKVIHLAVAKGKYERHAVEPLPSAPSAPAVTAEQVAACTDVAELQRMWGVADETLRPVIEVRAAEVKAGTDGS